MINLKRFVFAETTNQDDTMDTTTSVNDEAEGLRALRTILALSSLLGEPMELKPNNSTSTNTTNTSIKRTSIAEDSVAAWSVETLANTIPSQDTLAESVDCPPFIDPSSVVIADQVSLEFELEAPRDNAQVVVTSSLPPPADKTTSSCQQVLSLEKAPSMDSSSCSSSTKIRFRDTVCIVEIPSHRDMDPTTIESIWSSVDEVHENAQRNSMEYHADGRDWQQVKEEDEMILDDLTGELVHPATWEDLLVDRHHQKLAEAQRQHRIRAIEQQQQELAAAAAALAAAQSTTTSSSSKTSPKRQRRRKTRGNKRVSPNQKARRAMQSAASLTRFADT